MFSLATKSPKLSSFGLGERSRTLTIFSDISTNLDFGTSTYIESCATKDNYGKFLGEISMQAYRLIAKVSENGKISLPEEYNSLFNQEIELILFDKEETIYDKIESIKVKKGIKNYTETEIEQIIHEFRNI